MLSKHKYLYESETRQDAAAKSMKIFPSLRPYKSDLTPLITVSEQKKRPRDVRTFDTSKLVNKELTRSCVGEIKHLSQFRAGMVDARSKRKVQQESLTRSRTPIRRSNSKNPSRRKVGNVKTDSSELEDIDILSPTFASAGRAAMGSPAPQFPDKVVITLPWDEINPKVMRWSPAREGKYGQSSTLSGSSRTTASRPRKLAPPSLLISMNSTTAGDNPRSGGGSSGLPGPTSGHQITPGKMKPQGAYAGRKSVVSKRSQNVLSGLRDVTAFCQSWTQMLDQREGTDTLRRVADPRRKTGESSWRQDEQQQVAAAKQK